MSQIYFCFDSAISPAFPCDHEQVSGYHPHPHWIVLFLNLSLEAVAFVGTRSEENYFFSLLPHNASNFNAALH
jgi:hypothetical protein